MGMTKKTLEKFKQHKSESKITINKKEIEFSFNNIFECKTASGIKFTSCADICIDYNHEVSKMRFCTKYGLLHDTNTLPPTTLCLHVIASNSVKKNEEHDISNTIIYSDPHTPSEHLFSFKNKVENSPFGSGYFEIIPDIKLCGQLKGLPMYLTNTRTSVDTLEKQLKNIKSEKIWDNKEKLNGFVENRIRLIYDSPFFYEMSRREKEETVLPFQARALRKLENLKSFLSNSPGPPMSLKIINNTQPTSKEKEEQIVSEPTPPKIKF
jgi:hypothetical protein